MKKMRSTTIISARRGGKVAIGGDGQVSLGDTVLKSSARKIRELMNGKVLVGFAGATADAFTLLERFEEKLGEYPNNVRRAAIEMAKLWRTDRVLRHLESMMIVIDRDYSLILGGSGDVIESDDDILAIGSGGQFATAAARALMRHTALDAEQIVRESLKIAGEICVYTNDQIIVQTLGE
ncbi:MAG: ATP-dependent protease subunit HslV [Planctomycetota bacterium]|nr:ATP-dependent protease subunit HslV [Planctomycetota bacterium]